MGNYKIRVNNEAESKEAQELFFELGFRWKWSNKREILRESIPYLFTEGKDIFYGVSLTEFDECDGKELTLPQLRDLVAQSKSKVREYLDPNDNYKLCLINPSDAAHWMIEVPETAKMLTSDRNNYLTFWDGDFSRSPHIDLSWLNPDVDDVMDFAAYKQLGDFKILWKRATQDPALISGADAKLAWANGKDIQISHKELDGIDWTDLHGTLMLSIFEADHMYIFRLKPQTFKLELELPKPFKPKIGEKYWYLKLLGGNDYDWACFCGNENDSYFQRFGAWRTKEEIKQVVEQLRKIKGAV